MNKKTIRGLKKLSKLSPKEKAVAVAVGAVVFPVAVVFEMAKNRSKPKRRKTGGRGHGKKDYWPYN